MAKKPRPFSKRYMTLAIFEKVGGKNPIVLMGYKETGENVKDSFMFLGGKIKPEEKDYVESARREAQEESGFFGLSNMRVAELRVTILKKRQRNIIQVILFTSWKGDLKEMVLGDEFKELVFIPLSEIPWNKVLPGEHAWITRVLLKCKPSLVRIKCGKSRRDLLSIKYSTLTYS